MATVAYPNDFILKFTQRCEDRISIEDQIERTVRDTLEDSFCAKVLFATPIDND
jgi:hypothetical protein